ncbi:hypothetical protein [Pseudomonas synxantha]|nr:hypothetical protein [Pseudomonas synxantha]
MTYGHRECLRKGRVRRKAATQVHKSSSLLNLRRAYDSHARAWLSLHGSRFMPLIVAILLFASRQPLPGMSTRPSIEKFSDAP